MVMRWIETPPAINAPAHPPLDALLAARLQLHADRPETPDNAWWSVMLDLRDVSLEDLAAQLPAQDFLIPSVYSPVDRQAAQGRRLVAVFIRHKLLLELNETGRTLGIVAIKDGMIHPDDMIDLDARFVDPTPIQLDKKSVVMAVIDDGIAIANNVFRDGVCSSRVAFSWVMAAGRGHGESAPETIGRSFDKAKIDRYLTQHTYCDLLDEAAFYHETGQIDFQNGEFSPVSLRRSHGTHIAAVAAGHPMEEGLQTRPMICVSLPPRVTADTTGQSSFPAIALALQSLHHQASRFRIGDKPAPVVLNFSFGNYSGPHDGTGEIEALFQQFLDQAGAQVRQLVLPAGNGNLTQTHAEVTFPDDDRKTKTLTLQDPTDDRTATHIQMWMPRTQKAENFVTLSVCPPVGPTSPVLKTDGSGVLSYDLVDEQGMLARLSYSRAPDPIGRGLVTLTLAPNSSLTKNAPTAPAGQWTVAVTPDEIAPPNGAKGLFLPLNSVQVWVRRDETLPGFDPGGRQAQLDDRNYQRFGKYGLPLATDPMGTKSLVRRAGSLSGFACGASPIVIGGAIAKQLEVSPYSASGPITPVSEHADGTDPLTTRTGPNAVARADDSLILSGIISAGSHSGSFVRLSGTSVAAPGIARLLADELSDGLKPDLQKIAGGVTRTGQGFIPVNLHLTNLPYPILEPFGHVDP
ncbi:S8 family serine peptidase [uncultured Pelagimonas sp.]|uniref:S8 family serine peptidase n=1 Tax=uncultured Pelagimonas sp. TaxID=1618102 RepID=UPI0026117921|nr:S8 family serine peptidase [uncultured Pelagimonas sp.]